MSLLDLASLVLAPTATKEGKVYSAIPDTGEGDMTFTRGSSATRVNSAGLIEKERANLALHSNDFTKSVYLKSDAVVSSTRVADPFGGTTAWSISFGTSTNSRIEQQVSTSGIKVQSVWVRVSSGTQDFIIGFSGSEYVTKTATTEWQRFETFTPSGGTFPRLLCEDSATLEVYGFQVEQGLVAQPYIETTTTAVYEGITDDVPRVDYSGGGCPSLLLEGQRTNHLTQSEYYSGSTWIKQSGTTVTQNTTDTLSPEGKYNASKVTSDGSNGLFHTSAYTGGGANTKSIYLKGVSGGEVVYLKDPYQTVSTTTCTLTTEWQRFTLSETQTSSASLWIDDIPSGGIYMWGAMLETSASYASSYLPTYGTSTTRVADFALKSNASNLIGQTEGTMCIGFTRENNSVGTFSISANNVGTRIYIGTDATGLICQVRNG